jgi:hypothetical protein
MDRDSSRPKKIEEGKAKEGIGPSALPVNHPGESSPKRWTAHLSVAGESRMRWSEASSAGSAKPLWRATRTLTLVGVGVYLGVNRPVPRWTPPDVRAQFPQVAEDRAAGPAITDYPRNE